MIGKVKVINSGFSSTIQDQGRIGFAKFGVPESGAMDKISFNFANSLLGNDKNCACIEWVFQPPILQFYEPTTISLTGASTDCFVNDKLIKMYHQIKIEKGDILSMNFCRTNVYGYVGVSKGFLAPVVLGSRSFFRSITSQFRLQENDEIEYYRNDIAYRQFSNLSSVSIQNINDNLIVFEGPEYDQLSHEQKQILLNSKFTISPKANRMAIQLEEKLPNSLTSMITSPVLPGTVQLTPSGDLIVLMRDCQTTGGYPRVLQLSEKSIDVIAQKRAGDSFKFLFMALS